MQKAVHFACVAQRLAVVRGQTIFEALGFPHVDYLAVFVLHQVDARFGGKVSFPGGVEEEAAIWTRRSLHFLGKFAIDTPLIKLPGDGGISYIAAPGNGQLQAESQVTQGLDTLLLSQGE